MLTGGRFTSFCAAAEMTLDYSWYDPRLGSPHLNPCLSVYETMLSISAAEAGVSTQFAFHASVLPQIVMKTWYAMHFWLPLMEPLHTHDESVIDSRQFFAADWDGHVHFTATAWYYSKQALCTSAAGNRFKYPFDKQTLKLSIPLPPVDPVVTTRQASEGASATVKFATCGSPGFATLAKLPTGSEWAQDGELVSERVDDVCVVYIRVRYNPSSWMWEFLFPTTAVSLGSLAAIILDAKDAGVASARSSVILVAMLLLVEANSALFSMPYAMWVDVFSLLQVGVLSGAVVETWIIHAVARTRPHLSDAIDYCCCYIFPYSYFVMLFSMIFYANDQVLCSTLR
eukprot:1656486-Prymnesium_polylepis.2